uniref:two-partner secretion domain-containing protein n=1 Tax=Paraburkholderia polaris TaxID=2728848 RepID=UPI002E2F7645|nr:filamentous hemagglutinin N-terminal domain-containing protein [Paraburkholderia polaris]
MNRRYRLVYSRARNMLVAVEETAMAAGKAGETRATGRAPLCSAIRVTLCRFLPAALLALAPMLTFAQIVSGGAHAPGVIQTPNGLDQVNINRPSGAGVSVNTYNRFDVQSKGAILNNSPTIVQTQQGGTINGNPNFAAGQSAKIIVNQINSASASQLNGFLETAGNRAEVIIANPSGISVSGGGFINTSRAILTTGTPNYAADGSVSGFNVTGGNITVSGAGLNASNVDQVDFLARAVQANAAIYAKNLDVVTGANSVDHNTLSATPIAGDGPVPGVSIDVSNLGGMYANRIVLVGTEAGVGVSLKGVVGANAGDLVLTTQGKLELASQASASGNISASARDGIDNSGTTYAQQNVNLNTTGVLTNSGMIAAQQNTTVSAGAVNATGTFASGVNGDGSLAQSGDLNVNASGGVAANGRNVAGGNAPFAGSNPGGYQAAPADIRNYSLPSYESSFVAGGTLSGSGISIDNTAGNAGIPSLGLAPGQAVSGVSVSGLSGNASGAKSGAASVSGGAGMVNPTIASATAQNVLQNLTVPQGGLFSPATAPGSSWLVETNPAFTNQKTFISSDYYLQQLGLNPQTTEKRLGDGFYEQQLVRNQITSLTGKAVLGPYTDLQSMYQAMLAAGASLSQSLNLPLGMSLSPEQVAALTSNVVIMQTEIVDGQSVLVPVVYLAKASQQNMNGPLIAATDIDIQNAQTFTNSGTVQAGNTLSIQGNQISNAFGTLQSGGLMSLTTKGSVDLTSATVNAGSLALNAGGDLLLNTAVKTVDQVSATGATRTTTTLGPIVNLNVAGNAAIVTGGNFEQNAGNLNVGGNLGMAVGGNYDIGSVQTGEHKIVSGANGVSNTSINQTTGSSVSVGGVSQIGVGGDLTATGANINLGGGGVVAANGNVMLQAAKATSTVDSNSSGSDSHGSYSESLHRSDDTLTATTLNAGNSLTVASRISASRSASVRARARASRQRIKRRSAAPASRQAGLRDSFRRTAM